MAHHHPRQVKHFQRAGDGKREADSQRVMQQRQRDAGDALQAGGPVNGRGLVQLGADVVEPGHQNDKVKADILPHHRQQHGEHVILFAFPVNGFFDPPKAQQQLV
ncbi:hypothetical protein SDC9_109339 [bioreactor metagenome]|uniref:Uncharacterized protein n=1 Tax=bioreactor metagenome TaxID=1076179 RepID=A0A645BAN6_9ZZZZ